MISDVIYAALAAHVYNDQRGNGNPVNGLLLPAGWVELGEKTDFDKSFYDRKLMSFTANAYLNESTGEVVIAYKGTDFLLEASARAWNTAGDLVTDLAAGIGASAGIPQFVQAAMFYADVKAWAEGRGDRLI